MSAPEIGTVMEDGTVYAGISPETGNGLFVTPNDVPLLMNASLTDGRIEAMNINEFFGHSDWRLPTLKELNILFENKEKSALSGTFNMMGTDYRELRNGEASGWYRSSDWGSNVTKRCKLFKDGSENYVFDSSFASVRLIREGALSEVVEPSLLTSYARADITVMRQDRLKKLGRAHRPVIKS